MGLWGVLYNFLRHGSNFVIYPGAFEPRPRQIFRPSDLSVPLDYEEVTLTAKDGVRLQAYVICQPEAEEEVVSSENKGKQREVVETSTDLAEERDEGEGYAEGSMEDLGLDIFTLPQQHTRRRPSRTSRRSSRRSSNATASALPTPTQTNSSSQVPNTPITPQSKQTSNPPMERSSTSSTQKTPTTPSSPQFAQIPEQIPEVKPSEPSTPSTPAKPPVHPVTPTVLVFHGNANDIGRSLPLAAWFHQGPATGCTGRPGCRALRRGWTPSGEGWGFDYEEPESGKEGDRISHNEEGDERACGGMKRLKDSLGPVKCNVVMLSPRGYGNSEGSPCMKGFQRDADAALDYIIAHPRLGRTPIIIYGQSLGGAVAIDLVARRGESITALIVENTFTSLRGMIRDVLPVFSPIAPFMRAWNSIGRFPPVVKGKETKKAKGTLTSSVIASVHKNAVEQKSTDGKGHPLDAPEQKGKQRVGWFSRIGKVFSRKPGKSGAESQPLGRKHVRHRPKRTMSVYPEDGKGKSKKLKRVPSSVAVLMLSGARDGVVPPAHMRSLWEAATAASGDGSPDNSGSQGREVRTEGPLRSGTMSSVGSASSETSISDHKVLQLEPESRGRNSASDETGRGSHRRSRLATFVSFPQGTHDDTWDNPGYWGIVGSFLERCMDHFASSEGVGPSKDTPAHPRRGREQRAGGLREGTADSGIGMGIVLGDPRLEALRKDNHQPRKRQSWDGTASRRRESWESLGMHRPATSGTAQVGARVSGGTRARSRSSCPPSPSIMESLAVASAWAAPEEPVSAFKTDS